MTNMVQHARPDSITLQRLRVDSGCGADARCAVALPQGPPPMRQDESLEFGRFWEVLGPFPGGMRELPFGACPPCAFFPNQSLFDFSQLPYDENARFPSSYGKRGETGWRSIEVGEGGSAKLSYEDADWSTLQRTAGWQSLQYQALFRTTLRVAPGRSAERSIQVAAALLRGAEFAIVPHADGGLDSNLTVLPWYSGDWYSYNANTEPLPVPHILHLKASATYTVLVRAQYEMRIFGDPGDRVGGPQISFQLALEELSAKADQGQDATVHRLSSTPASLENIAVVKPFANVCELQAQETACQCAGRQGATQQLARNDSPADPVVGTVCTMEIEPVQIRKGPLMIVPDVVDGWFAGWGLGVGVLNGGNRWEEVLDVSLSDNVQGLHVALARSPVRLAPGQVRPLAIQINQCRALTGDLQRLGLHITVKNTGLSSHGQKKGAKCSFTRRLHVFIPLRSRSAPSLGTDSDPEDASFDFTHLAPDGTLQRAVAIPPFAPASRNDGGISLPPVVLVLHGAGVEVEGPMMRKALRRQREAWVVMPSGRTSWGYDWHSPSMLSAVSSIETLSEHLYGISPTLSEEERLRWAFNPEKVMVVGHSNGGQGAWYMTGRLSDKVMGGVVAAGYIKIQDYVPYNWHLGRHYIDPSLTGVLMSSLSMFDNDLHASNLAGLPILVKYGSEDDNVPTWHSRDMRALVNAWQANVSAASLSEVQGKGHWWDEVLLEDDVQNLLDARCSGTHNPGYRLPDIPDEYTLTVANPSECEGKGGIRVVEVDVPGRLSSVQVRRWGSLEGRHIMVLTRNVRRLSFDSRLLDEAFKVITVDGIQASIEQLSTYRQDDGTVLLTREGKVWKPVTTSNDAVPATRPLGPVGRFLSTPGPIQIVLPTGSSAQPLSSALIAQYASIAQRFALDCVLYGRVDSEVLWDWEVLSTWSSGSTSSRKALERGNLLVLGGPHENAFAERLLTEAPSPFSFPARGHFSIQGRTFDAPGTGLLFLHPHPTAQSSLALVLSGTDAAGLERAARLLPVRTGTPLPEWAVISKEAEWKGAGGILAAGWWGRHWEYSPSMSYL